MVLAILHSSSQVTTLDFKKSQRDPEKYVLLFFIVIKNLMKLVRIFPAFQTSFD